MYFNFFSSKILFFFCLSLSMFFASLFFFTFSLPTLSVLVFFLLIDSPLHFLINSLYPSIIFFLPVFASFFSYFSSFLFFLRACCVCPHFFLFLFVLFFALPSFSLNLFTFSLYISFLDISQPSSSFHSSFSLTYFFTLSFFSLFLCIIFHSFSSYSFQSSSQIHPLHFLRNLLFTSSSVPASFFFFSLFSSLSFSSCLRVGVVNLPLLFYFNLFNLVFLFYL